MSYRVTLFGGFDVSRDGESVPVPAEAQRLVAFVSLHDRPLPRSYVAGSLWRDSDEVRARANLRSTLWRLRRHLTDLLVADSQTVGLSPGIDIDIRNLRNQAARIGTPDWDDVTDLDHRRFALEFLPGWYDEWVVVERERVRQLCLHSLESVAGSLAERRMFGAAIQALLTSISLDPLRESPQRQLLSIHLAEGNRSEAVRQYNEFVRVLADELGLDPSPRMRSLLDESDATLTAAKSQR